VLTGRRREPLETVVHRIRAEGGTAHVEPGDLMDPDAVKRIGAAINDKIGRLDILVNNAGVNINDRHWDKLTPENAKLMIDGRRPLATHRRRPKPMVCRLGECLTGFSEHPVRLSPGRQVGREGLWPSLTPPRSMSHVIRRRPVASTPRRARSAQLRFAPVPHRQLDRR
jgi:hypothetical protein